MKKNISIDIDLKHLMDTQLSPQGCLQICHEFVEEGRFASYAPPKVKLHYTPITIDNENKNRA